MMNAFLKISKLFLQAGLFLSLLISTFSIYSIFNSNSPTVYTLTFWYSLFFSLGIIYYIVETKMEPREKISTNFFYFSSHKFNKLISISYYIIIVATLIVLSKSLYVKPISYYLLISIATIIIGFQIILKQESNVHQDYVLLFMQIIPLAIIIRGSSFFVNPYMIGPDVPWHFHSTQSIISSGYLDSFADQYYYYPMYHIIQSISGIIIGFSTNSLNLINLIISVCSICIAYLLGREAFNSRKIGLIYGLLLSIATMHIFLVTLNTSKIGGTTLFLLCLLLLIKRRKFNSVKTNVMFLIIAAALFFWHPEISAALVILSSGETAIDTFSKKRAWFNVLFILLLVGYIAYLIYSGNYLFTNMVQYIFKSDGSVTPTITQNLPNEIVNIKFLLEVTLAYIGITLPTFAISYMGLKWLQKPREINLMILFSLMSLHILPLFGVLSGNLGAGPDRTLTYVSIFVLLIFSRAIFCVFNFKNKYHIAIFVTMLFIFSFFSTSSYLIGDGNKILKEDIPIGTIFTTESNLASYNFLEKIPQGSTIIGDYESLRYTTDSIRGFLPLPDRQMFFFPTEEKGYLIINQPNLERLSWRNNLWGKKIIKGIPLKNKSYDNGDIMVLI